jgi:hypothetical protein
MKQLKLFILYGTFLLSIFSFATMGAFYSNEPVSEGDELEILAIVRNPSNEEMENVNLKLFIYDLGIMINSHPFDVGDEDTGVGRLYWTVPSNIPTGTYFAKLTASNDRFRDWQHMYITIV